MSVSESRVGLDSVDFSSVAVTQAPMGILLTDEQGVIRKANARAAQLFGAPRPEDLEGQRIQPSVSGNQNEPLDLPRIARAAATVSHRIYERTAFASEIKCDCTFVPMGGEDGGLLVFLQDVREKLLLENNLFQAEKLSALDTIVGGVAHELNNPLTAILGYTEYLLGRDIDPASRKYIVSILEAAQRCTAIVDSLRVFAQRNCTPKTTASVNRILEEVIGLCSYQLRIDKVDVTMELDPAIPEIPLQVREFQRVFLSVIVNAQHAFLGVTGRQKTLHVRTVLTGSGIHITFTDNGAGMSEDVRSRVFDPFFTTRSLGEGIGLGMSVAYGIVRNHQGSISVQSEEGQGSAFSIELPVPPGIPPVGS